MKKTQIIFQECLEKVNDKTRKKVRTNMNKRINDRAYIEGWISRHNIAILPNISIITLPNKTIVYLDFLMFHLAIVIGK